jgi:hypothetical protein
MLNYQRVSHQLQIGGDPLRPADAPGSYDSAAPEPRRCEHQGSPVLPAELNVVSPWLPVVVSKIPSIPGDFYHRLKDAQDLAWSLGVCLPNWTNWTWPIYHKKGQPWFGWPYGHKCEKI